MCYEVALLACAPIIYAGLDRKYPERKRNLYIGYSRKAQDVVQTHARTAHKDQILRDLGLLTCARSTHGALEQTSSGIYLTHEGRWGMIAGEVNQMIPF